MPVKRRVYAGRSIDGARVSRVTKKRLPYSLVLGGLLIEGERLNAPAVKRVPDVKARDVRLRVHGLDKGSDRGVGRHSSAGWKKNELYFF